MMEVLAAAALGLLVGRIATRRSDQERCDHECEVAYLTGHVDGYRKAQDDSGEVWA